MRLQIKAPFARAYHIAPELQILTFLTSINKLAVMHRLVQKGYKKLHTESNVTAISTASNRTCAQRPKREYKQDIYK